jgi:hypothetical protein
VSLFFLDIIEGQDESGDQSCILINNQMKAEIEKMMIMCDRQNYLKHDLQ